MTYNNLDEVRAAVEANGDVLTVQAWDIRDAYGADRLGTLVRESIAKALLGLGIGTVAGIPDRAQAWVRLYKLGTPAGDVIEAVISDTQAGDARIREAAGGRASELLNKIREMVCEPQ